MCCCGKPVINGEMGYKWQPNDAPTIRHPHLPAMQENDVLLYDEPGRCGGTDCHSHDYRVVKDISTFLLYSHGGGEGRIRISSNILPVLASLDSNGRYWVLSSIFFAQSNAAREATDAESYRWREAAAQKRIRTKKQRGKNAVKVWIEQKIPAVEG